MTSLLNGLAESWLEGTARARVAGLLDPGSFYEFIGPEQRQMSPHLPLFDLPGAFDDGVVVGQGTIDGKKVFVAAQEGQFMGGTFAEVSGGKINGLLQAARDLDGAARPKAVVLLMDTGGVRLQEANAGELAVAEVIRAIFEVRQAGIPVFAFVGGRAGAFGGGGIIAATCSRIVISEHGRTSVSGPEVIETNKGVEEFDSKDRALVWRITGGRTRALLGGADVYVEDSPPAFRAAAIKLLGQALEPPVLATLQSEQQRLSARLVHYGDCRDAPEIWRRAGIAEADKVADLSDDEFLRLFELKGEHHDAR